MSKAVAINLKHQTIIGQNVLLMFKPWNKFDQVWIWCKKFLGELHLESRQSPKDENLFQSSPKTPTLDSCKTVESLKFGHILPTESQKIWLIKSLDPSSQAPHRSFTVRQGDLVGRILLESDALHWWAAFGGLIFTGHDFSLPPEKKTTRTHMSIVYYKPCMETSKKPYKYTKRKHLWINGISTCSLCLWFFWGFSRWFPSRGGMSNISWSHYGPCIF